LGKLPTAAIPDLTDLRSAQRALATVLIHEHTALVERGYLIHLQLSQLGIEGVGLEGLAEAMAHISGRGVLIQDKRLQTLAEQPAPGLLGIWPEVVAPLQNLASLPEALRDRKQAGRQAVSVHQVLPGNIVRLIMPIRVGEMARGYISLLIASADELDALDRLVIEQGALVCGAEMFRSKAIRETEKRLKGRLLSALLQNDLSSRDASLWVESMDLDLAQQHVALRFTWNCAAHPSRRRLETLVNEEARRRDLKLIVSSVGAEVVCFCQAPPETHRPEATLELARAVIALGAQTSPECAILVGVGTVAGDLSEWQLSFRQAGQALEMARKLGATQPLYFSDLLVYRLLMQIEHSPELIAFQEETLGPLLAHDSSSDLLHTLEAFFEHNYNLAQAAEALFIHRNTLVYRLERIAEITRLNLDLPETRLSLQLALHITRMRGVV
jgi:purine catabolism regulator